MAKFKKKRRNDENFELDNEQKTEEIERQRAEQEFELRRAADAKIKQLKLKVKYAKEKSRELDVKFRTEKRGEYQTNVEFLQAFHANQVHHQKIIEQLEAELKTAKAEYKDRFESGDYKIKRWFYGVGKEFNRITWLNRKGLGWGFLTVASLSLILAVIFLIIDVIFSAGYF